jgi:hypothetical protein
MNRDTKMQKRLAITAAGFCVVTFGATSVLGDDASSNAALTTVLGCGHTASYLKIDPTSGKVVQTGNFAPVATGEPSALNGCLISDVYADTASKIIFVLMTEEAEPDADHQQHYRLVAMSQTTLRILAAHKLPTALDSAPALIFDHGRNDVLLNYDGALERYSARPASLLKPTALPASGVEVVSGKPFAKAYTDSQGNIIDGAGVLHSSGSKVEPVPGINIYDALNDSIRKKFEPLVRVSATGAKYLDINLIGSAGGGRTAYVVGEDRSDDRKPFGGVIVYDIRAKKIVSAFPTRYPEIVLQGNTVHLTPDGTRVVVEDFTWERPEAGSSSTSHGKPVKTGNLAIYDASTGDLENTIKLAAASGAGDARVVNFSNDGHYLYYELGSDLHIVDLVKSQAITTVRMPANFAPIAAVPES